MIFMEFITSTANCFICCGGLIVILIGYVRSVLKE
jgi:hypothetical protein